MREVKIIQKRYIYNKIDWVLIIDPRFKYYFSPEEVIEFKTWMEDKKKLLLNHRNVCKIFNFVNSKPIEQLMIDMLKDEVKFVIEERQFTP